IAYEGGSQLRRADRRALRGGPALGRSDHRPGRDSCRLAAGAGGRHTLRRRPPVPHRRAAGLSELRHQRWRSVRITPRSQTPGLERLVSKLRFMSQAATTGNGVSTTDVPKQEFGNERETGVWEREKRRGKNRNRGGEIDGFWRPIPLRRITSTKR